MASNPSAKIQKFMPRHYVEVLGKNIPAIYEAINNNVAEAERLIQACIDQLFLTTASGEFLIKLGEEQGFIMPPNSGLDILSYRVLVPITAASPKQVRITLDQLIQAFYQNERTKPIVISTIPSPYSVNPGDDIIIETEQGTVTISFASGVFSDFSNVSAQEIASLINVSQDLVFAESVTDRITGVSSVRLTTSTLGSGAFIRVAGGKLQNILKFPNLIETLADSSTTWNLSKASEFTDLLTFTWDGSGTNPNIFLASAGDIVSLRGFVDGAFQFSLLNGTYELIDVGYDYFVVKNVQFKDLLSTVTQPADNSIIFTKNQRITLFDSNEYALTSEAQAQTITLTVPAVPPLARRFLQGSAHVHGDFFNLIDFERSFVKIGINSTQDLPDPINHFLIFNNSQRADFTQKFFKTQTRDSNISEPTYIVESSELESSVFPYTVPTIIGSSESVFAEIGSSDYIVKFDDYRHGMQYNWGFTLGSMTAAANLLVGDLNKEHVVKFVKNENEIVFEIRDFLGNPIEFEGIPFAACDVIRQSVNQFDGSDFYLDFGTPLAAINSGLTAGLTFRLDPNLGTSVNLIIANALRYQKLTVTSVDGQYVRVLAGLGTGPQGTIITSVPGLRSSFIGGTNGTYFCDKTSTYNQRRIFSSLRVLFAGYTPSSNPLYLGPYIYDPAERESFLTVSKFVVLSESSILKGESVNTVLVNDSGLNDEEFPQSGQIVMSYGNSQVEGPIRFNAFVKNQNTSQILIDPSYRFKKNHPIGTQILFIRDKRAYTPTIDGSDYPWYVTGTTAARNSLFQMAELLVASGIFVEADVILPDLRYTDSSIPSFA